MTSMKLWYLLGLIGLVRAAKFLHDPFDDGTDHDVGTDENYYELEDEQVMQSEEMGIQDGLTEAIDVHPDDEVVPPLEAGGAARSRRAQKAEDASDEAMAMMDAGSEDHSPDVDEAAAMTEGPEDAQGEEPEDPVVAVAMEVDEVTAKLNEENRVEEEKVSFLQTQNIPPERQYIGSLTDPKAHPYVYTSRADAEKACQQIGYRGLCTKNQVNGWERCAYGWMIDFKGYWMSKSKRGCGSGKGFRNGKYKKKLGAYCCNLAMNSLYIGSLSNPDVHPYVYSTRLEAEEACHKAGFRGLCAKSQIEGYERCAAGWLSDWKGYWMRNGRSGCGSGGMGYRSWGNGKVGAYCCAPTVNNIQYIGSLTDTKAHPYVYNTREDAAKACKAAGFHGLCTKAQGTGYSRCAAGWYEDYKGYWFHKAQKGCRSSGSGYAGWGNGKVGAYCCNLASNVQYIGSLTNPKAHPYVYSTMTAAQEACETAGYRRLCRKFEINGYAKCAAGWTSDWKGYWMDQTRKGCGHGRGYRGWGDGKVGAYCCSPTENVKYIGSLSDPSAHPYVYEQRSDATDACKKSGYRRLCYRSEIEFYSLCKAGWMIDWKGYWFDRTHKGCGTGTGYRNWGKGKVGAYCCEKLELPLCHSDQLSASKGVWRCDEYSGATGSEAQCTEKYQQIEADGKVMTFKCVASDAGAGKFNCLTGEKCQTIYPRGS